MLLALQDRLASLISADPYFVGITPITERRGDLATAIEEDLARNTFAVLISAARGESLGPAAAAAAPAFVEEIAITVAQSPVSDAAAATRNTIDAVEKIILAVNNQPLQAAGSGSARFRVVRHEPVPADPGLSVHQVIVNLTTIL